MSITQVVMPCPGEPEVLALRQAALPEPGPGQVRVRVEATGVAFAEVQMLRGRYYAQPRFPFVPGYDLVGRVEAVGPRVDLPVDARVAAMTRTGAWADAVVVPAKHLVSVPEEVDAAEVVALITNGVTAWQMLHRVARVGAGQTVVVHGAAGGVGTLLVTLAVRAGARVIGTASAGKHGAVRALGAVPLDYRQADLAAQVRRLALEGATAVFDHVAGPGLRESWRMLGRKGTLVVYGSAGTMDAKGWRLAPFLPVVGRVIGSTFVPGRRVTLYAISHRRHFRSDLVTVLNLLAKREIQPEIAARLPLTDAAKALRMLVDRRAVGKIVLLPAGAS